MIENNKMLYGWRGDREGVGQTYDPHSYTKNPFLVQHPSSPHNLRRNPGTKSVKQCKLRSGIKIK